MNMWILVFVYVICSAGGLLIIKEVFNAQMIVDNNIWQVKSLFRLLMNVKFLAAFLLYVSGFVMWLYMLSRYELSLAFPIASGALYIGLLIGSILWLHEEVGIVRGVGVFLILVGILIVSKS